MTTIIGARGLVCPQPVIQEQGLENSGACLGSLDLRDAQAAGRVSNMYEIAGARLDGRKVVSL